MTAPRQPSNGPIGPPPDQPPPTSGPRTADAAETTQIPRYAPGSAAPTSGRAAGPATERLPAAGDQTQQPLEQRRVLVSQRTGAGAALGIGLLVAAVVAAVQWVTGLPSIFKFHGQSLASATVLDRSLTLVATGHTDARLVGIAVAAGIAGLLAIAAAAGRAALGARLLAGIGIGVVACGLADVVASFVNDTGLPPGRQAQADGLFALVALHGAALGLIVGLLIQFARIGRRRVPAYVNPTS